MRLFILISAGLFGFVTRFRIIDKKALLVLLALYLISAVLEYVFNNLIAKKLSWVLGKILSILNKLVTILLMLAVIAVKTKLWKVAL